MKLQLTAELMSTVVTVHRTRFDRSCISVDYNYTVGHKNVPLYFGL